MERVFLSILKNIIIINMLYISFRACIFCIICIYRIRRRAKGKRMVRGTNFSGVLIASYQRKEKATIHSPAQDTLKTNR